MAKKTSKNNGPLTLNPRASSRKAALATIARSMPAPAPDPVMTHDQVAARAFQIWERKGRPIGLDVENWREAEAELRGELSGAAV